MTNHVLPSDVAHFVLLPGQNGLLLSNHLRHVESLNKVGLMPSPLRPCHLTVASRLYFADQGGKGNVASEGSGEEERPGLRNRKELEGRADLRRLVSQGQSQ